MRHDKATMNSQRKILAVVGFLLPVVSVLFGLPFITQNGPTFWHSISATYYATSGDFMRLALGIFGFFLICYKGYDIGDNVTCTISGMLSFGIVIFPCLCDAAGPTAGIFNLPTRVSHVLHCIDAMCLFGSFAYMIGFRFTKTDSIIRTEGKVIRDKIYTTCSDIIIGAMVLQIITSMLGLGWMTIVNETIMLWAFSFAWAVKADVFKKFIDKN